MIETNFENSVIGYLIKDVAEPTPSQWADMHRRYEQSGEMRLVFAIFEDAVRCYLEYGIGKHTFRKKSLFEEAERWIFSDRSCDCWTFEFVCQELGFHPECWRKRLREEREKGPRKIGVVLPSVQGPKLRGEIVEENHAE